MDDDTRRTYDLPHDRPKPERASSPPSPEPKRPDGRIAPERGWNSGDSEALLDPVVSPDFTGRNSVWPTNRERDETDIKAECSVGMACAHPGDGLDPSLGDVSGSKEEHPCPPLAPALFSRRRHTRPVRCPTLEIDHVFATSESHSASRLSACSCVKCLR